jgi:hypothetical protein
MVVYCCQRLGATARLDFMETHNQRGGGAPWLPLALPCWQLIPGDSCIALHVSCWKAYVLQ